MPTINLGANMSARVDSGHVLRRRLKCHQLVKRAAKSQQRDNGEYATTGDHVHQRNVAINQIRNDARTTPYRCIGARWDE